MLFVLLVVAVALMPCSVYADQADSPADSGADADGLGLFVRALELLDGGDVESARPLLRSLAYDEGFPLQVYAAWKLALALHEDDDAEGVLDVLG